MKEYYIVIVKKGTKEVAIFRTKTMAASYLGINSRTILNRTLKTGYYEDESVIIATELTVKRARKGFAL